MVETTNFSRGMALIGASRNARSMVERFTRVSPGILEYQFTVDDPTVLGPRLGPRCRRFERSTRRCMSTPATRGNYALPNILAGARKLDAK